MIESGSPTIVHVINTLRHRGGVTRVLMETLPRLNKAWGGHEILYLVEGGAWAREFEAVGVPVSVIPFTTWRDLSALRALRRWLRSRKVDLLHLHMPETVLRAFLAGIRTGIPYVVQGHGIWTDF